MIKQKFKTYSIFVALGWSSQSISVYEICYQKLLAMIFPVVIFNGYVIEIRNVFMLFDYNFDGPVTTKR